MTREWCDEKAKIALENLIIEKEKIDNFVNSIDLFTEEEKKKINNVTDELLNDKEECYFTHFLPYQKILFEIQDKREKDGKKFINDDLWKFMLIKEILDNPKENSFSEYLRKELHNSLDFPKSNSFLYLLNSENPNYYYRYMDSEEVEFDGDIVITDPCYVIKDREDINISDAKSIKRAGFREAMSNSTLYGDWGCTTRDPYSKHVYGYFGADAGLVCVLYLNDIEKICPENYDWLINHGHPNGSATIIKDFKGKVQFKIKEVKFRFGGEDEIDYQLEVVGTGINKKTGKPCNFIGSQTSP